MRDFASQVLWPFPNAIFNFFVEELVEEKGSRQLRMLSWFSLIWSQFQFFSYYWLFFGEIWPRVSEHEALEFFAGFPGLWNIFKSEYSDLNSEP